jgi:LysM repeat protein
MKKLLTLLFILPLFAFAQKTTTHTVVAKESFSSIGRMYNINPRELAKMNSLDYEKGLSIGQVIKVPVTKVAVVAKPVVVKEVPVIKEKQVNKGKYPVKHIIAAKETLYGLSKQYKTTVDDIKKWNNLTADVLKDGTEIIVGYSDEETPSEEKVFAKVEAPLEPPVVKKVATPEIKKMENPVVKVEEEKEVVKEPVKVKKEIAAPKKVVEVPSVEIETTTTTDFKGGVFKNLFTSTGEEENGVAGVFKSTSGWEDGKFYCLHNGAQSGTILKITNKVNGKSIYAKVLDTMPDLKPNASLVVRVSSAAADVLGAGSNNFNCSISY